MAGAGAPKAAAAGKPTTPFGSGFGGGGGIDRSNAFLNLTYIEAVNKRINDNFGLFQNYQINPYTKKTLLFVTPKVTERPPACIKAQDVPGYDKIVLSYAKAIEPPQKKYSNPQTEGHRYGWFPPGSGYFDTENYDERFKFSHQTAEFIHTAAQLREYDRLMKAAGYHKRAP